MILDGAGTPLVTFDIAEATTETAFVFGEVYRRAGAWKVRAVGQGWDSGLVGLATDFGVSVDDETGEAADTDERDALVESEVSEPDGDPIGDTASEEVDPALAAEGSVIEATDSDALGAAQMAETIAPEIGRAHV